MTKRELSKDEVRWIRSALTLLADSIPSNAANLVTISKIKDLRNEFDFCFTAWIEDDK